MKRAASIFITLLLALNALATIPDYVEDFGIFDGRQGGGAPLYPPQSDLLQWLTGSAGGTNATAQVGVDAPIVDVPALSFDGVNDWASLLTLNAALNSTVEIFVDVEGATKGNLVSSWGVLNGFQLRIDGSNLKWFVINSAAGNNSATTTAALVAGVNEICFSVTSGTSGSVSITINGVKQTWTGYDFPTWDGVLVASRVSDTTAAQFCDGTYSLIEVKNDNVTLGRYPLEENYGTIAYDVSGNGSDGAIYGPTWTSADGIASCFAGFGGTVSGSTNIPALSFKSTSVGTFDGVADFLNAGSLIVTSNTHVKARFKYTGSLAADVVFFGIRQGGTDLYFGCATGKWRCGYGAGGATTLGVLDNEYHDIDICHGIFTLDGVLLTTRAWSDDRTVDFLLGCRNLEGVNNKYSEIIFESFSIDGHCEYDFQVTGKSTASIPDISGNDNPGAITTGAGGLEAFWTERASNEGGIYVDAAYNLRGVEGDIFPHNSGGYSLALANGTTNTYTDLITHTNGVDGVFVKKNADLMVTDVLVYTNGFTAGEWTILDLWMGIPLDNGPIVELEYDLDGSIQLNEDGSVELVLP